MGVTSEQENNQRLLKNDIDKFEFEELDLAQVLIDTIAAKKKNEFVDPFQLEEESTAASEEPVVEQKAAPTKGGKNAPVVESSTMEEDDGSFKFMLGKKHFKDSDVGDAGCLYKEPEVMPRLFFIRASFCNKLNAQMPHTEL